MTRGATHFDERVARYYEAWYQTPEGRSADRVEKASLRRLLGHFPGAGSILEVGSGTGHFARWFREQGLLTVGLDLSAPMLCQASAYQRSAQPASNGARLVQADAYRLPFADGTFDLVAYVTTVEFLEAPAEALAEAVRVASRGLILGVLNRWSALALRRRVAGLFNPTIYETAHFYGVGELKRLLLSVVNGAEDEGTEQQRPGDQRDRMMWHTTLFPRWLPWRQARLPWGGFIAMALSLPG